MRRLTACAGLLFALTCPHVAADVVELHANAGFDAGTDTVALIGAPSGGTFGWTATDLTGDAGSGALVLNGPPGRYTLQVCLRPMQALGITRQVFDFAARVQGSAPAAVRVEGIFEMDGDQPTDLPCEGPWLAYLVHAGTATVLEPAQLRSAIPATASPQLRVRLAVDKSNAGPLFVDDWSVRVDTDVIFRDDDQPATGFSL